VNGLGHRRLRLILALTSIAFVIVVGRAVQVQVFESSALTAKALAQQSSLAAVPGLRGSIFDRNHHPLAQDQPAVTVIADQTLVKDKQGTAIAIAVALGYRYPQFIHPPTPKPGKKIKKRVKLFLHHTNPKRAHRRAAYRREVALIAQQLTGPEHYATVQAARQVPPKVAKAIMSQHLPGISTVPEGRRFYPGLTIASQLLGYTDIDGDGVNGAGLEHMLNPILGSRSGEQATVHGPDSTLETITVKPPHNGRSVTLTLVSNVQAYMQRVLGHTVRQYGAASATGIMLDPRTGAVLGMVTAPGYNDNVVHQLSTKAFPRLTKNAAVQDAYEPGSVMKVVTFSAALTNHIITPSTQFRNLPDHIQFYDKTIKDAEARGPETFTAKQILEKSSNVGTDTIARMVGPDLLQKWIYRYGLGKPTALHLPGESPGIVRPLSQWSGSSLGTIPIGQGISVTAMQMADIYAAIANGGVMPQPHVIERVAGRRPAKLHPRRIIKPGVDRELVNMLAGVVNEPFGTGVLAQIPGYTVAGKTGTAEKPINGVYSGKYVATFVGFLPAGNPQVEILVSVDSPRNGIFGGTVAAPAFAKIGQWYARTYNIPPDKPVHATR
jgi:cell division protein FtsI (penicillin-binding protein 3)